METTATDTRFIINLALSAWETQLERFDKHLEKLTDQQLESEIAPGRNRGVYILGHLTAVNDNFFPLFGLGEKVHPPLQDLFIRTPDRTVPIPTTAELRQCWHDVNAKLTPALRNLTPEEWLGKHTSVSAEDFAKEPHRNKLNVLLNRTSHQAYHYGQIVLL
ncbi:DinB family protein [Fulvivirgaceae bacterium PWU5]|uniref:DinB family protein n=1 Tax=Dawidia cretensis TaxID=2782350 RepID=A0AAP2GP52_9BACT|nr:DinB family protein [Dawidia cretensis]MBT1707969.1 DinB family protein [Dawidia cretensis]